MHLSCLNPTLKHTLMKDEANRKYNDKYKKNYQIIAPDGSVESSTLIFARD